MPICTSQSSSGVVGLAVGPVEQRHEREPRVADEVDAVGAQRRSTAASDCASHSRRSSIGAASAGLGDHHRSGRSARRTSARGPPGRRCPPRPATAVPSSSKRTVENAGVVVHAEHVGHDADRRSGVEAVAVDAVAHQPIVHRVATIDLAHGEVEDHEAPLLEHVPRDGEVVPGVPEPGLDVHERRVGLDVEDRPLRWRRSPRPAAT